MTHTLISADRPAADLDLSAEPWATYLARHRDDRLRLDFAYALEHRDGSALAGHRPIARSDYLAAQAEAERSRRLGLVEEAQERLRAARKEQESRDLPDLSVLLPLAERLRQAETDLEALGGRALRPELQASRWTLAGIAFERWPKVLEWGRQQRDLARAAERMGSDSATYCPDGFTLPTLERLVGEAQPTMAD